MAITTGNEGNEPQAREQKYLSPIIISIMPRVNFMNILDAWLDDAISRRFVDIVPAEEDTEFSMLAGILRAEGPMAGFSPDALEAACSGDISAHLLACARLHNLETV